jgi:hypothetical protein
MCFAGINKGASALGALMLQAAQDAGCAAEVAGLLADTQPALLDYFARFVPAMLPKARRWAPEMREIGAFAAGEAGAAAVFQGLGDVLAHLADGVDAHSEQVQALERFCRGAAERPRNA